MLIWVAAVILPLQPLICDVLHTLEDWTEPHQLADAHCQHEAHDAAPCEDAPALTDVHHCCNGHERPLAVMPDKTRNADSQEGWSPLAWNTALSCLPAETNCSQTPVPPPISSDQAAQGKLCALLCRWLI